MEWSSSPVGLPSGVVDDLQSLHFATGCDGGAVPTSTSALDVVDGEVRELIRRRGLDPFTDPGPVRVLVRDVVADYFERSLTSALPPAGSSSRSTATPTPDPAPRHR